MSLDRLQENWEQFGKKDPYWAILTDPHKRGQKWDVEAFYLSGQQEIKRLMHDLEAQNIPVVRQHALDFGCGAGRLTRGLADYFQQVTGIDIALSMIELGQQRHADMEQITYLHNPHPDLRLIPTASVDFIYSNITLQHIPPEHTRTYLREFMRVLRPNGVLVFQLPAGIRVRNKNGTWSWLGWVARWVYRLGLEGLYRRIRYFNQPIMDMHWVERPEVEDLLQQAGGTLLNVREDHSAGALFESWRYFVRKNQN